MCHGWESKQILVGRNISVLTVAFLEPLSFLTSDSKMALNFGPLFPLVDSLFVLHTDLSLKNAVCELASNYQVW